MPRISQLPALTTADNADEIAIVDVSASKTKKITRGDLVKSPLPNNSVTTAAIANNAVTADKLDSATRGDYSTAEVDTGRKWIDGKTIYKKTINFGALPNNTTKSVAHGITGITYVIGAKGFADNGSMGLAVFIPQVSPVNLSWNVSLDITSTDVVITTRDNYASRTRSYITVEYVK